MSVGDDDLKRFTWEDLKDIIAFFLAIRTLRAAMPVGTAGAAPILAGFLFLTYAESAALDRLRRTPAELAEYNRCKVEFNQKYGGTLQFILRKRLEWIPDEDDAEHSGELATSKVQAASTSFLADKRDVKILYNDYPYAIEHGIVHVVVWSKAPSPKQADGYIDDDARAAIAHYVSETFEKGLGMKSSDVLWFRNTTALQSVRALEHFHVLLRHAPPEKLNKLIGSAGYLEKI